jgi:thymidylate synthase ThyX
VEKYGIKVDILPNYYLGENGVYNKDSALNLGGKIAGVCYDKEGFNHLVNEPVEKTNRRIDLTLNNGHHSVYDHLGISFNIQNLPKILAMVLNNEHEYTTSEKSARYTPVVVGEDSIITTKEEELYNKWIEIYKNKIKEQYGYIYNDSKIQKLAQENARYLVTVFMPTQMIYTTSLRQINYIASWMKEYIDNADLNNDFEKKLSMAMKEFVVELSRLNVLDAGLLKNEKHRSISLFGNNLKDEEVYFGSVYSTLYKGSYAQLAQAHRHRTLDYQIEALDEKSYYIPPIIADDEDLVKEWLKDMESVSSCHPQGELVLISEKGKYEDFILKCKERLCSAAQVEIAQQTKETLTKYKEQTKSKKVAQDIVKYTKGARCTFSDFDCTADCKFKEGKLLTRRI